MIKEDIPFGDGEGMHIARIEGPAAGYALYLLGPGMEETGEGGGEWQKDQMIGEDIPFGNGGRVSGRVCAVSPVPWYGGDWRKNGKMVR